VRGGPIAGFIHEPTLSSTQLFGVRASPEAAENNHSVVVRITEIKADAVPRPVWDLVRQAMLVSRAAANCSAASSMSLSPSESPVRRLAKGSGVNAQRFGRAQRAAVIATSSIRPWK
jgi:hypothetical protein